MSWKTLLAVVPRDLRDSIAGDLEEEFRARRGRVGAVRALVWLWLQAARVAMMFRWERTVHGRPLPPIGDEIRASRAWESIWQDVVFAGRLMRRQPGFTAVAVLALGLGTGAGTAIFSVVDSVLWRPLPFADSDRIVALGESRPREGRVNGTVAPADFYDWRRDSRSFAAVAAYFEGALNLTGHGEPQRVRSLVVTPAFLAALGIRPALGRDFRNQEEVLGRHRVVLLTDAVWRRQFGADASVVGHTVSFDGNLYEIVGVLPAGFWWPSRPEILVPLALDDGDRALRGAHFLSAVARRHDSVSLVQAREEMNIIGRRLSTQFPLENANHFPSVLPLREALVGDTRTALLMLLGAVALVLLIACANVAMLLLARATARQKELAVRMAVGGGRRRLVQQLLTESLVLAALGGGVGLLLASWSVAALRRVLPEQFSALPGVDHLVIDARVFVVASAAAIMTGLIFGAGPALIASNQRVSRALNDGARDSSGGSISRRMRSALVVVELAFSIVLLVGAGLLMISFHNVIDVSPGFRPQQLHTVGLSLPSSRYGDRSRAAGFYRSVIERLRAMPGVERVAATSAPPFTGIDARLDLEIEKRTIESPVPVRAHPRLVTPEYFQTMGIPLVHGRSFTDRDSADAPPVVIINEAAAKRFWTGRDPVGERISLGAPDHWMEIVGVVGDVRHVGLDAETTPEAYIPYEQPFTSLGTGLVRTMSLVVRTGADAAAVAAEVKAAVAGVDDQQPVGSVRPMDALIAESVAPRRLNLMLLSIFAAVAVALTAAGLYGVMAYLVTQRTREIGVRMALGASPRSVVALVVRQAGPMTLAGIAAGMVGAYALARYLASLLFGVSAAEPLVYGGVSLVLGVVALLAIVVPSSRAARIDPLTALHEA